jgi:hypothetical protein
MGLIKLRKMKWAGHVLIVEETRNSHRVLVGGKPEVRRLLGRTKRRWEDNIKIDFTGI